MGYNSHIFKNESLRVNDGVTRIAFAGKISVKKGVESLIRSLDYLEYETGNGLSFCLPEEPGMKKSMSR